MRGRRRKREERLASGSIVASPGAQENRNGEEEMCRCLTSSFHQLILFSHRLIIACLLSFLIEFI